MSSLILRKLLHEKSPLCSVRRLSFLPSAIFSSQGIYGINTLLLAWGWLQIALAGENGDSPVTVVCRTGRAGMLWQAPINRDKKCFRNTLPQKGDQHQLPVPW